MWVGYHRLGAQYGSAQGTAGEGGRFFLRLPDCDDKPVLLVAQLGELGAEVLGMAVDGGPVLMQLLPEALTLRGSVVGMDGAPVEGAIAVASYQAGAGSDTAGRLVVVETYPLRATTGADGRYELPGVPRTRVRGVEVWAPGFVRDSTTDFRRDAGDMAPAILKREARVAGRVLYEGQPVAGVVVRAQFGDGKTVTDNAGRFELAGLYAGEKRVLAVPPNGELVALPSELVTLTAGQRLEGWA